MRGVKLSRREREIMDVVYRLEAGEEPLTGAAVREAMQEPGSYSAVRAQLRTLVEKGHLEIEQDGPRYVYRATVPREQARQSAMKHLLKTFFGGDAREAAVALLTLDEELDGQKREQLERMIQQAQEEGR